MHIERELADFNITEDYYFVNEIVPNFIRLINDIANYFPNKVKVISLKSFHTPWMNFKLNCINKIIDSLATNM